MVDTADDFVAALNAMLARINIEHLVTTRGSRRLRRQWLGKADSQRARRASASHAVVQFDDAIAIYQSEYAKINGKYSTLFPEVKEGLEAMRELGIQLACATNKPHRFDCSGTSASSNISR